MSAVRLQLFLAKSGVASRRRAETMIEAGEIEVNGQTVRQLGTKVDPVLDRVSVRGQPVQAEAPAYLVLNKPKGYVTTAKDPDGRPTVFELLPPQDVRLYTVGRLDFNTEGALLLTNDGELAHALMHPSRGVHKVYHAKFQGEVSKEQIRQLRQGVDLPPPAGWEQEDHGPYRPERSAPAEVALVSDTGRHTWLEIAIHEGKNRQLHRMAAGVGSSLRKLVRVAYGSVTIEGLETGEHRRLSDGEVAALRQLAGLGLHPAGLAVPEHDAPTPAPRAGARRREGATERDSRPASGRGAGERGHGISSERSGGRSSDRERSAPSGRGGGRTGEHDRVASAGRSRTGERERGASPGRSDGRTSERDRGASYERTGGRSSDRERSAPPGRGGRTGERDRVASSERSGGRSSERDRSASPGRGGRTNERDRVASSERSGGRSSERDRSASPGRSDGRMGERGRSASTTRSDGRSSVRDRGASPRRSDGGTGERSRVAVPEHGRSGSRTGGRVAAPERSGGRTSEHGRSPERDRRAVPEHRRGAVPERDRGASAGGRGPAPARSRGAWDDGRGAAPERDRGASPENGRGERERGADEGHGATRGRRDGSAARPGRPRPLSTGGRLEPIGGAEGRQADAPARRARSRTDEPRRGAPPSPERPAQRRPRPSPPK